MRILDEEINLTQNIKLSLVNYRILWLLFLISILFDSLTTMRFMYNEGISKEANLLIRWLATHLSIIPGVIIGKSLQLLAALGFTALSLKYSRAILMLLISLNLLASYHNY